MSEDQKARVREADRARRKKSYYEKKADKMIRQGLDKFKPKHAGKDKAKVERERKARIAMGYKAIERNNSILTN